MHPCQWPSRKLGKRPFPKAASIVTGRVPMESGPGPSVTRMMHPQAGARARADGGGLHAVAGHSSAILRLRLRDRRGQPGYPPIDRGWSSSARSLRPQLIASEWHRRPRAHAGAGPQGSSDAHCLSPQRCRSASLGRLRFASLWQSQRRHGHCIPGQRRSGACTLWTRMSGVGSSACRAFVGSPPQRGRGIGVRANKGTKYC